MSFDVKRAYTKTPLDYSERLNAGISVPLILVYEDSALLAHKFPCPSVDKKSLAHILMRFLLDLAVKSRLVKHKKDSLGRVLCCPSCLDKDRGLSSSCRLGGWLFKLILAI